MAFDPIKLAQDSNALIQKIDTNFQEVANEFAEMAGGVWDYAVDTGVADACAVTLENAPASYVDGMKVALRIANANTGPSTLDVNGLGPQPLCDADGASLAAGALRAGDIVEARFDGAVFRIAGLRSLADAAVTGAKLADGAVTEAKLADGAVTNAKLADMAEGAVKGRSSGSGAGEPSDLTSADLMALIADQEAGSLSVTAIGGALRRGLSDKLGDHLNAKDFGALGDNIADNASSHQAYADAVFQDSNDGNMLTWPSGRFRTSAPVGIDAAALGTSGHLTIRGDGFSSQIAAIGTPITGLFELKGTEVKSLKALVTNIQFGSGAGAQDNVAAAVFSTPDDIAFLDSVFSNLYVTGVPRFFDGDMVSTVVTTNLFDFMPDVAFRCRTNGWRANVILGNYFYKTSEGALDIDGSVKVNGAPVGDAERNGGTGMGHSVIGGNLYLRPYQDSETQRWVNLKFGDNIALGLDCFMGHEREQSHVSEAGYHLNDMRGISIAPSTAWRLGQGHWFEAVDNSHLDVGLLRDCNVNGSGAVGALHLLGCNDVSARATVVDSGGAGVSAKDCSRCTLDFTVFRSAKRGVVLENVSLSTVRVTVYDANQVDAEAGSDDAVAIDLINCRDIRLDVSVRTTTPAAGHYTAIRVDGQCSNMSIRIEELDALSLRSGGTFLENAIGDELRVEGCGFIAVPLYAAERIGAAGDSVNSALKATGRKIIDTTSGKEMYATGPRATDPWRYVDGSGVIAPA